MFVDIYLASPEDAFLSCPVDQAAERMGRATKVTVIVQTPDNFARDASDAEILAFCERIFALGNDHPQPGDEHACLSYYQNRVRSISVGDVLAIPRHGLYTVDPCGFTAASKALRAAS